MSLKAFHIFFISASVLLAVMVATWAFLNSSPVLGGVSALAVVALLVYQSKFIRMARALGLK